MRFLNKVILITGGASGIGLATAQHFASEGAQLVLTDIDEDALNKTLPSIKAAGNSVIGRVCNVAIEMHVEATVREVLNRFGRIDVLVNNAGLMEFKSLETLTGEDWLRILSTGLLGAFYFIKQGFLHMKPGSSIVNVSSIHAVETEPLVAPYAAAKAALLSLTRSAAIEGKTKGIRVNAVLPGAVDTPMLWQNPNVQSGVEQIDQTELGLPEDIAKAIAFLASDEAAFVQGAELRVDGGRLARL